MSGLQKFQRGAALALETQTRAQSEYMAKLRITIEAGLQEIRSYYQNHAHAYLVTKYVDAVKDALEDIERYNMDRLRGIAEAKRDYAENSFLLSTKVKSKNRMFNEILRTVEANLEANFQSRRDVGLIFKKHDFSKFIVSENDGLE